MDLQSSREARRKEIDALVQEMQSEAPKYVSKHNDDDDNSALELNEDEYNDYLEESGELNTSMKELSSSEVNTKSSSTSKGQSTAAAASVDTVADKNRIPISHQVMLKGHNKVVSSIALDSAGNRVITGSLDYTIRLYDFGGMDMRQRAFKSFESEEGYPLSSIYYSPSGDKFIAATGSCQPKVYNRDGEELIQFARGDMYLTDLSHTKGHTMEVTGACWHPSDKNGVLTASLDGSVRVWDITGEATFGKLINKNVIKIRIGSRQNRVGATCCSYSADGTKIFVGISDGSIQVWLVRRVYGKPDIVVANAHEQNQAITAIGQIPKQQNFFISRATDNTIKVWKVEGIKKATLIATIDEMYSIYSFANFAFSPEGNILCCPTCKKDDANSSMLYFVDLSEVLKHKTGAPSVKLLPSLGIVVRQENATVVHWPAKLNQIFVGASSGAVIVYYDPRYSVKGVILSTGKNPPREKDPSDFGIIGEIQNPGDENDDEKDSQRRIKRAAVRRDPILAKIPERPKGDNSTNSSFFFTKYIMEGRKRDATNEEDPREALLKMDQKAKEDPVFVGRAYAQTQPTTELYHMSFEQEQEEHKSKIRKL